MDMFCKIWPRKRLGGETLLGGTRWRTPFNRTVDSAWVTYGTPKTKATSSALTDGDWFQDDTYIYFNSIATPAIIIVEFPLYLSNKDNTYYSTPTDDSTDLVDWDGGLTDIPKITNGSTDSLYGIAPLQAGGITYANGYGELNELLYECSFNYAKCKAWYDGQQVFTGYVNGFTLDQNSVISFNTIDFMSFFDRSYNMGTNSTFNTTDFSALEPTADGYYKRIVYGMLDGFKPINIDYNSTPSTTNNRVWATHRFDTGDTVGTLVENLDHLAANTATRTYFENTPQVNVGDWVILVNNGTTYRTIVQSVNRSSKYIDHQSLGARTFAAADTSTRYFIGFIYIQDQDGLLWSLQPGRDYTVFTDAGNNICAFTLADDFESTIGFTHTPFDPSAHTLYIRVYGHKDVPVYSDLTDVGAIVDNGGIAAQAVSVLYDIITNGAGFDSDEIYKPTFEDVGADSLSIGLAIPERAEDNIIPTCRELIEKINSDMLWALGFYNDTTDSKIKIGLMAYRPFIAAADYTVDKDDIIDFRYSVDYADTYSRFLVYYKDTEIKVSGISEKLTILTASLIAQDLHLSTKTYTQNAIVYDSTEALKIASRLSYALGDRRALYNLVISNDFLNNTNLGTSYGIVRGQLPGFTYELGVTNERQTSLIEVQKSVDGVSISLDDQKGIQDNSGVW